MSRSRNALLLTAVVLGLLSLPSGRPVDATGMPTIAVDTNAGVSGVQATTTFPAGTTGVAIVIAVVDAPPSGAFEFTLGFDPRWLQLVRWSEGPFLRSTGRITACVPLVTERTIRIGCVSQGTAAGANGSGALATLVFQLLAPGQSCLSLSSAEMATTDGSPIATATQDGCITLATSDTDGDGVGDPYDNCPTVWNADQANSDAAPVDNGRALASGDGSVPAGDAPGDACDADDDNDGLADASESPLAGCGTYSGMVASHDAPARGDTTNDDDGNGVPAWPMGLDFADNGTSADTDGDGSIDGYECAHGSNPRDPSSRPAASPDDGADDDGDGLPNDWERRGWGTDPGAADTDGDGVGDCVEAVDVDGNGVANFSGDTVNTARAVVGIIGQTQDFDLDRNGTLNLSGDVVNSAMRTTGVIACR